MAQIATRKAEAAVALAVAGATPQEIADALGFASADRARQAVEGNLATLATPDDKRRHRTLANARYERLLVAVWLKATDPDCPEQLPAIRQAKEIVDRIVALHGAAAPQEVVVHTPTTDALQAWVAKVMAVSAPPVEEADVFELPAGDGKGVVDAEIVDEQPKAAVPSSHDGEA